MGQGSGMTPDGACSERIPLPVAASRIGANTALIGTSYACVTKSAPVTYVWM